jgi:hypothetical protein
LFDQGAPAHLIEPFLEKIAVSDLSKATPWVSLALERPMLRALGVCLATKHFCATSPIWPQASAHFKECSRQIGIAVLQNEVPQENTRTLLQFSQSEVVSSVAVNLWQGNSTPQIPEELLQDWKNAVVTHVEEDDVLGSIFEDYPDVAYRWINTRIDEMRDGERGGWFAAKYDYAMPRAMQKLTAAQRRELIGKVPPVCGATELLRALIGRDSDSFRQLLNREELRDHRLDPLCIDYDRGHHIENVVPELNEDWQNLAIDALDRGFSEEQIFGASQSGGWGWSGSESAMYAARVAQFEGLLQHADARVRKIGEIGANYFSKLRDKHMAKEKRAAIRGEPT